MGGLVNTTSWSLYPEDRSTVPIVHAVGWASGPGWTDVKKEIFLPSTGVKPNRSEGLICNSYGKGY